MNTTYTTICCGLLAVLFIAMSGCRQAKTTDSGDESSSEATTPGPDDGGAPSGHGISSQAEAVPHDDEDGEARNGENRDSTTPATSSSEEVMLGTGGLTAGIPGEGPLTLAQIEAWINDPVNHQPLKVKLPMGLAAAANNIQGVDENPMTRAKIELGRQLYFDARLSSDHSISCASCHHPDEGYARHTQFGEGVDGQKGNRNSPVSYNRIVTGPQFWDGRAASLEEQAKGPIENPIEMANTHEMAIETLQGIEGYRIQFAKIFPDEGINIDTVAKAIATFERALVTQPAPYDYLEVKRSIESQFDEDEIAELEEEDPELYERYAKAAKVVEQMSEAAIRGRDLFFSEKANCTACHAGANFSDEQYHNLGVGMDADEPDLGRFAVTNDDKDRGAFKTPTVRNVALTAPYMHDGSQATLEEVMEWYDKGGHPNPHLSDKIKKLGLTDSEHKDLLAFMTEGLTSAFPAVEQDRLPE